MPLFVRTPLLLGAAVLVVSLAACDETGGASGGSVQEQLRDARLARQAGRYDDALRLLADAHAQDPQSAPVRVEYSLTLLEERRIDLLDLDRVARFLTRTLARPEGKGSARPAGPFPVGFCPYAADPTAQAFDPTDFEGFDEIRASRDVLEQALELLAPVMPAAFQTAEACTSVVRASDGSAVLAYDATAARAELRARGLTDSEISAALATSALARFLRAYLTLTDDLPPQTTWYRLSGGSSVGVCSDDPLAVVPIANTAVRDIGDALFSIDLRAETSGRTSTSRDLIELVVESYEEVRDGIARACTP